ncbi:MAG TPA: hypothetical protein PK890_10795, partial [Terrimesophilobacter sp.]|nr:hypothetical protein [Terrimesophilobacter sp.]
MVHPAELRARRAATVMLGVAVLVYLGASLAGFGGSPGVLSHWWWMLTLTGRLVFGIALVVVPWFAGQAALRVLAFSFATFGLVTTAASLVAVQGGMTELLRDQALYAWAAALALRPVWAWAWIIATELLAVTARLLRAPDPITLIESSLVSFTTTVLLVILLIAVLQTARTRDRGEQAVLRAISQDAEHAAIATERARNERVVH